MIWTEKTDRKYSRRTKAIYFGSVKWNLMSRGFMITALIVGIITRPTFSHGDWVALGIIGGLFLGALVCLGILVFHMVRVLRSCAMDRRRRNAGLPLDEQEPADDPANR